MSAEQMQIPGLLVSLASAPVAARYDDLELALLDRLQAVSSLSRSEVIRRCVRLAAKSDESDVLGIVAHRIARRGHSTGRKPRSVKISELEKTIAESLRAAEHAKAALEEIKASKAA